MKISVLSPCLDNKASGLSMCIPAYVRQAAGNGWNVSLYSKGKTDLSNNNKTIKHYRVPAEKKWFGMPASEQLCPQLINALPQQDIVHIHGIWTWEVARVCMASHKLNKPFIVSPHGSFSNIAMQNKSWKKKPAWGIFFRSCMQNAAAFHVTSEKELMEVRKLGFKQPVAIIPIGIDPVPLEPSKTVQIDNKRTLLYLGRLHPIKGVELLLECWGALNPCLKRNWRLKIVGPAEPEYRRKIAGRIDAMHEDDIVLSGPVYGDEKWACMAGSDLYVLPSKTENFAISVGEALASGLPVITTTQTPWQGIEEKGCGWWVQGDFDGIKGALTLAMGKTQDELAGMGAAGRAYIHQNFCWDDIGKQMSEFYHWVAGGMQDKPKPFIHRV